MKKLLLLLFLYILVEGNNIIGDGLYVYHRGKHAVDEFATKVDEYYPKVQAIDTVMAEAIQKQMYSPPDSTSSYQRKDSVNIEKPQPIKRQRRVIRR